MRSQKFFYLKNVNINEIDAKYDIKNPVVVGQCNYTFTDELRHEHHCLIINSQTSIKCWWCRSDIGASPVYCPIKKNVSMKTEKYYSQVKKTWYDVKEIDTSAKPSFVVDGSFCSWECCVAWINDGGGSKNSMELLHQMHLISTGKPMAPRPAPHWRLLRDYGGNLDIDIFRNGNIHDQIINHGMVTCIPMGLLCEKKINF